jgi:DNA-binding CsgD family transcriptional regulator
MLLVKRERAPANSDRFVTAIEAIYAAATSPAHWPPALHAIAQVFDDVGANLLYQRDDNSLGGIVSPALQQVQRDYHDGWWRQDIRFFRGVEKGYCAILDAITDHHVVTEAEIAEHPFYKHFLAKHGLRWFAGTSISPDPRVAVAVAVQRAIDKPPFNDSELELLARLGRHVEHALRLGIRIIDAEITSATVADVLGRLGAGIFLLDGMGRVLFQNPACRQLLGDGLVLSGERLMAQFAPERDALQAALVNVLEGGPDALTGTPRPILVRGSDTKQFLAAYVLPVSLPSDPIEQLYAQARALVLVTASKADDPPDPTVLRDLLGLTLGEARVAALVGTGLAPREAATKLGIAEETARTILKRVFTKVGVSRQSELATLMTRLVLR